MDNTENTKIASKVQKGAVKPAYIVIAIILAVVCIGCAIFVSNSPERKLNKQLEIARVYMANGDYEQAIAEFSKVLDIDDMNVEAYLGMAAAYEALEDYDAALAILQTGFDKTGDQTLKDKIDELNAKIDELNSEEIAEAETEMAAEDNIVMGENGPFTFSEKVFSFDGYYIEPGVVEKIIESRGLDNDFSIYNRSILKYSYSDSSETRYEINTYVDEGDGYYRSVISDYDYIDDNYNYEYIVFWLDEIEKYDDEVKALITSPVLPGMTQDEFMSLCNWDIMEEQSKSDTTTSYWIWDDEYMYEAEISEFDDSTHVVFYKGIIVDNDSERISWSRIWELNATLKEESFSGGLFKIYIGDTGINFRGK